MPEITIVVNLYNTYCGISEISRDLKRFQEISEISRDLNLTVYTLLNLGCCV